MRTMFILTVIGLFLAVVGIFMSKYPRESRFLTLKEFNLENLTQIRGLKAILNFITKDKNFILNKFGLVSLKCSETNLSLQALYIVKFFCMVVITVTIIVINYTNLDITKVNIISKAGSNIDVLQTFNPQKSSPDSGYNYSLYYTILDRVNHEGYFEKMDDKFKREHLSEIIPGLIHSSNKEDIEYNVQKFLSTWYALKRINLFDWKIILIAILSFFSPEIFLLMKWLLLGSVYRKEVIRLENIFELLGSMEEFKTTDILEQMAKGSRRYRKHMRECRELFQTDRRLAVESLRAATKNKKMSELVDTIRIYSLVDKKLAMDILAKNRRSKAEGILITADEDMDWLDIAAFVGITPLLYELANLMLKPMLDMVFEAFKYV
ncbi:hypothetical protein [Ruminiclostridium papyrosolvens]|uniref:Uncharacterized protein n=1 Tax=Ruminiclostridium papyrosolvens C7 TaxID=1330534 RepID=U4R2W8_9FIRM|nr:hypothetical protein [Ruminiclostridium papyrosolvens]EPR12052.1 hypothetical protein L323_09900 [Ruminiclostridium papyrosolvens C7]